MGSLSNSANARTLIASALQRNAIMKTATFPSLRVEAELREAAESVLREGETLTSLIETAVRETIHRRAGCRPSSCSWLDVERGRETHWCLPLSQCSARRASAQARCPAKAGAWMRGDFAVRYTDSARDDLLRLFDFLLDRAQTVEDFDAAQLVMTPSPQKSKAT